MTFQTPAPLTKNVEISAADISSSDSDSSANMDNLKDDSLSLIKPLYPVLPVTLENLDCSLTHLSSADGLSSITPTA